MRLLITGGSGLLGSKVVEIAQKRGYTVFSGYHANFPLFGYPVPIDLGNRESIVNAVAVADPDVIVHCAAITDVDKCEHNKELAQKVNIEGTRILVESVHQVGARMVFVSTDYVFDGERGMYTEEDAPRPINFYGYSKWLAEKAVAEVGNKYLIVRPSVIYGSRPSTGKSNFALWLLDSLTRKIEVKVLRDQFVSPTLNVNLALMLVEACERKLTGVYHMAGASRTSRYEFAVQLAAVNNLDTDLIKEAKMSQMNWIAKRPKDSSLDVSKAYVTLTTKPMSLDEMLTTLKEEMELDSGSDD